MDAQLNRKSLMLGIPGIVLQLAGNFMTPRSDSADAVALLLPALLMIGGTILLIIGLGYYASAKGHSRWWGLMGFLSLIGLIVLAVMPDRKK